MAQVFISYRRGDTDEGADAIHQGLTAKLGGKRVFWDRDRDALPPGADFYKYIEQATTSCDVALVLIGPGWLAARDEHGNQRLEQPKDWVRKEVAAVLARDDALVVPVLFRGAQMPDEEQLPESLRQLARRNALTWKLGPKASIQDLVLVIKKWARGGQDRTEVNQLLREHSGIALGEIGEHAKRIWAAKPPWEDVSTGWPDFDGAKRAILGSADRAQGAARMPATVLAVVVLGVVWAALAFWCWLVVIYYYSLRYVYLWMRRIYAQRGAGAEPQGPTP